MQYSYNPYYSSYLAHHGILGMHWGIRRYQNPDGSLTAAGKKHYSDDYNEYENLKKRDTKSMSNEELRKYVERKELEERANSHVQTGNSIVKDELIRSGTKLVAKVATVAAVAIGAKYVMKHSNITVASIAKKAGEKIADSTAKAVLKTGDAVVEKTKEAKKAAAKAILKTGDAVVDKAKDAGKGLAKAADKALYNAGDTIVKGADKALYNAGDTIAKGAEKAVLKVGDTITDNAKKVADVGKNRIAKTMKSAKSTPAAKAIGNNKVLVKYAKTVDKLIKKVS